MVAVKTKSMIVAGALMIVGAPVANASLSNEYVAETGHCVMRYEEDDIDALAVTEAVDKNWETEEHLADKLWADYQAESQRLRDDLAAGGGEATVPREDVDSDDSWMAADGVAYTIDWYMDKHMSAYMFGSSEFVDLSWLQVTDSRGTNLLGTEAVIPVSALKVATHTRDAQAARDHKCVSGESGEVYTPDATQAVADLKRAAERAHTGILSQDPLSGSPGSSAGVGVGLTVVAALGVLGLVSALADSVGLPGIVGFL